MFISEQEPFDRHGSRWHHIHSFIPFPVWHRDLTVWGNYITRTLGTCEHSTRGCADARGRCRTLSPTALQAGQVASVPACGHSLASNGDLSVVVATFAALGDDDVSLCIPSLVRLAGGGFRFVCQCGVW